MYVNAKAELVTLAPGLRPERRSAPLYKYLFQINKYLYKYLFRFLPKRPTYLQAKVWITLVKINMIIYLSCPLSIFFS